MKCLLRKKTTDASGSKEEYFMDCDKKQCAA